jgi:hypothetical protein
VKQATLFLNRCGAPIGSRKRPCILLSIGSRSGGYWRKDWREGPMSTAPLKAMGHQHLGHGLALEGLAAVLESTGKIGYSWGANNEIPMRSRGRSVGLGVDVGTSLRRSTCWVERGSCSRGTMLRGSDSRPSAAATARRS